MQPTVKDGAVWSVCQSVCLSVCLSVCHNREPAKTAEPFEMPFGKWTLVGPRSHALDGVHVGAT